MVTIGGQSKYWGKTVEEATEFWVSLGLSLIMVKNQKDLPLYNNKGVVKDSFKRLGKLQNEYGVSYNIHPYNILVEGIFLDSFLRPEAYKKLLIEFDEQVQENELDPLITLHPGIWDSPKTEPIPEEKVFNTAKDFYQSLELKSKIALEVMHDPYRNPGYALLGYTAEQFKGLINSKGFGICIDTGHLVMAEEHLQKFLDLPYPILSVHYNGNDGTGDQHRLPTRENVKDPEVIEKLLKSGCQIILELYNYGYSKEDLRNLIENIKKGVV